MCCLIPSHPLTLSPVVGALAHAGVSAQAGAPGTITADTLVGAGGTTTLLVQVGLSLALQHHRHTNDSSSRNDSFSGV